MLELVPWVEVVVKVPTEVTRVEFLDVREMVMFDMAEVTVSVSLAVPIAVTEAVIREEALEGTV